MRKGEIIQVERLESGLYKITKLGKPEAELVGGAASTAIALNRVVFFDEAHAK